MMAAVTGVAFESTPPGTYGIGSQISLRATFDEPVAVVGVPTIGLTIGATARPAAYVSGTGSNSLLFSYTISAGDSDLNGIALAGAISLPVGSSIKSVANASNATLAFTVPGSQLINVDAIAPVVSAVTRLSGATLRQGETVRYRVQFSEDAIVTGTPMLPLIVGSKTRGAAYVSGSGTQFVTFAYNVAGDDDGGGVPASLVSPNGGTITDRAGNAASLSFGPVAGFTVDVVPPTIVRFQSSAANGTYGRNAAIPITATVSETVPAGSMISVLLDTGARVVLTAAVQGVTLVGTFIVRDGDNTPDLTVSQVTAVATADLAGNPLLPTVPAGLANIGGAKDIAVNTAALPAPSPTLHLALDTGRSNTDGVTKSSRFTVGGLEGNALWQFSVDSGTSWTTGTGTSFTPATGSYAIGRIQVRQIDVAGNVSAPAANADPIVVDITGPIVTGVVQLNPAWLREGDKAQFRVNFSEDVYVQGTPTIPLVIGTTQRALTYASGSGTRLLVFECTITAGDAGVAVPGSIITLNGGSLEDLAGNTSGLVFAPVGVFTVDVVPPTIVRFQSSAADGRYGQGAAIPITATLSETVPAGSTMSVLLDTGASVVLTAAAQGITLAGTFVVRAGDSSNDLTVAQVTAVATTDLAGNPLLPSVPSGLANIGGAKDIVVRPTAATGITAAMDNVGVMRGFIPNGGVTDDDTLLLRGTGTAGSTVIVRSGTIPLGSTRVRKDGSWSFTTPRLAPGATHALSAAAVDMFGVPGVFSSIYTVTMDKAAPFVTALGSPAVSGISGAGDTIDLQLSFSEPVLVGGLPQLQLNTSPARLATYVSGSGTSVLTFRYVVQKGDSSAALGCVGPMPLRLTAASIRDAAGNAFAPRLSLPGSFTLHAVVTVDARRRGRNG